MKFLHISDLHIGKRVNEFSMIEDQKYILRQIKEIALEKQVDAVMIAGKRCLQSVEIMIPRNVLHLVHSL